MTVRIAQEIKNKGLHLLATFRLFDRDEDTIINIEDFSNGIKNILGLKMNQQEI